MDKKISLRRALPYITAILCFAAVSCIYFYPQFSGRALRMNDIVQYEGSSEDIRRHNAEYGEDPQWTGNMFSGMPATLISIKYDGQFIKKISPVLEFLGRPASLLFLAMTAFFLALLLFRVNPWVAIGPSIAYGLSTYFVLIIGAGHITKMIACIYAPLIVGGVWYAYRKNMWAGAAITAVAGSLQIAANHPQITYYFGLVIAALWINELVGAWRKKALKKFARVTGLLACAAILAVGSNLAPLWYISDYSKDSIRGGSELATIDGTRQETENSRGLDLEYATQWSYGKVETFNLLIPNLYGGSSEGNFSDDGSVAQSLTRYGARDLATQLPSYWGAQPITAGPTYLGAVMIFLFVLGLFILCPAQTVWICAISVLAVLLSWGRNLMGFTEFFFDYFPGYDKFRTVAMILVIVQWAVPLVAALALDSLWRGHTDRAKLKKSTIYAAASCGGVALLFLIFGGTMFDFSSATDSYYGLPEEVVRAMRSERTSMLTADCWRTIIYVGLATGVILLWTASRIKKGVALAAIGLLATVDLAWVDARFLPQSKFVDKARTTITATEADRYILNDKTPGYRVLNLTVSPFNDATTSFFHRSVGGYHGAKLARYQDLIQYHLSDPNSAVYDMLNTKYVIEHTTEGGLTVTENTGANGAAWFIEDLRWTDTPLSEIEALAFIDTRYEAVADRKFEALAGEFSHPSPGDYIDLKEYRANRLLYEYSAQNPVMAVFSEIYYPKGWTAYIDGIPAQHFRADYLLRAMTLPAGRHTVEFRYRLENYGLISGITLLFSILTVLAGLAAVVMPWICRKNKKTCKTTEE